MKLKLTAALVVALAVPALADSPAQVKAAIQSQMSGYIAALKARDEKKVEAVIRANFATEFKDVGTNGRVMNLEQTIKQLKSNVSTLKSVESASLVVNSVKVAGNKANTQEAFKLVAKLQNPNDPKKTHSLNVESSWTGTYVKKTGRWMCTSSKTLKETVLFDGKKTN